MDAAALDHTRFRNCSCVVFFTQAVVLQRAQINTQAKKDISLPFYDDVLLVWGLGSKTCAHKIHPRGYTITYTLHMDACTHPPTHTHIHRNMVQCFCTHVAITSHTHTHTHTHTRTHTHTHTHTPGDWQLPHSHICLTANHLARCNIHKTDTYHPAHKSPDHTHIHINTQTRVSRFQYPPPPQPLCISPSWVSEQSCMGVWVGMWVRMCIHMKHTATQSHAATHSHPQPHTASHNYKVSQRATQSHTEPHRATQSHMEPHGTTHSHKQHSTAQHSISPHLTAQQHIAHNTAASWDKIAKHSATTQHCVVCCAVLCWSMV